MMASVAWQIWLILILNVIVCLNAFSVPSSPKSSTSSSKSTGLTNGADPTFLFSDLFQVYIEDTDAYGIIYNSNYLKFYQRTLPLPASRRLLEVHRHKFKASPRLGDSVVVEGSLEKELLDGNQVWKMVMKSQPHQQEGTKDEESTVFNTATIVTGEIPSQEMPPFDEKEDSVDFNFVVYKDEFDMNGEIPLYNFLNYCERARSNFLGGAISLAKMQQEFNLLWVVTTIDDCVQTGSSSNQQLLQPGDEITLRSTFSTRRKGSMVTCRHTMLTSGNNTRVAQAVVSILAIDSTTGRPTSNVPSWLKERFGV